MLGPDDLFELPTIRAHPQVTKLRLTARLPRRPGVYPFRGLGGRVLYVGKAGNLRARVRSYFSGEERRKVSQLLRETQAIDHVVCPGTLEASVLEVRLIHRHQPPFNRRSKVWDRYAYLKLTLDEPFPRLSVVRAPRPADGCLYLGPLPSTRTARLVAEAVESAVPLRRCTARVPRTPRPGPCAPAQLGVSTCPCAGSVPAADYARIVDQVVVALCQRRRAFGQSAALCGRRLTKRSSTGTRPQPAPAGRTRRRAARAPRRRARRPPRRWPRPTPRPGRRPHRRPPDRQRR